MNVAPRVVFITQARTGSTRLPGKVMKEVAGRSVLYWFLRRALKCESVSRVCVATTVNPNDDSLATHVVAEFPEVCVVRGSEEDVLSRYMLAAEETNADIIVRVTSDCPFFDWNMVDWCVKVLKEKKADAVRTLRGDFPIGLDVEVSTRETLRKTHENASDPFEREHVGPYVFQTHSSEFKVEWVGNTGVPWPECRLTLDYLEDFALLERLYAARGPLASAEEYKMFLTKHPEVAGMNLDTPY
jgi:spore coat polysaccharide biosynthesis protein SpsF